MKKTADDLKRISLIVPFRNEEKTIPKLIESIQNTYYPEHLIEVVFVDDHSTDHSVEAIKKHIQGVRFSILSLSGNNYNKPQKKEAVKAGIEAAKAEIVITVDADCVLPQGFFYQVNKIFDFLSVQLCFFPVLFESEECFVSKFQHIESVITTGISAGGIGAGIPFMGSAAAMAVRKSVWEKADTKAEISSGDDVFLLENILKTYGKKAIFFCWDESCKVYTRSFCDIKAFFMQKLRWAYKVKYSENTMNYLSGGIIFLNNISIIILLVYSFLYIDYLQIAFSFYGFKLIIDILFLNLVAFHLKEKINNINALAISVLYPWYVSTIGVLSMLPISFEWKGRKIKAFEK